MVALPLVSGWADVFLRLLTGHDFRTTILAYVNTSMTCSVRSIDLCLALGSECLARSLGSRCSNAWLLGHWRNRLDRLGFKTKDRSFGARPYTIAHHCRNQLKCIRPSAAA